MTQRRCQNCREFYDKTQGICPSCGEEAYGFNVHLRKAGLNSNLYSTAQQGHAPAHRAAKSAAKDWINSF